MPTSWTKQAQQYKSPLSVVAGFLLRSRETQAKRCRNQAKTIQQFKRASGASGDTHKRGVGGDLQKGTPKKCSARCLSASFTHLAPQCPLSPGGLPPDGFPLRTDVTGNLLGERVG